MPEVTTPTTLPNKDSNTPYTKSGIQQFAVFHMHTFSQQWSTTQCNSALDHMCTKPQSHTGSAFQGNTPIISSQGQILLPTKFAHNIRGSTINIADIIARNFCQLWSIGYYCDTKKISNNCLLSDQSFNQNLESVESLAYFFTGI